MKRNLISQSRIRLTRTKTVHVGQKFWPGLCEVCSPMYWCALQTVSWTERNSYFASLLCDHPAAEKYPRRLLVWMFRYPCKALSQIQLETIHAPSYQEPEYISKQNSVSILKIFGKAIGLLLQLWKLEIHLFNRIFLSCNLCNFSNHCDMVL